MANSSALAGCPPRAARPTLRAWLLLALALLPLLALAQAPTVTRASLAPAANARTAAATTVAVPFSQSINSGTAGNI